MIMYMFIYNLLLLRSGGRYESPVGAYVSLLDPIQHMLLLATARQVLEGPHKVTILGHGDMFAAVHIKTPGSLLYAFVYL